MGLRSRAMADLVDRDDVYSVVLLVHNQVIVQRAMGARDLKSGQQGLMFAASLKILGPVMLACRGLLRCT